MWNAFRLFGASFLLAGCLDFGLGNGGSGGGGIGGDLTPPGDTGETANSALENPLSAITIDSSNVIYVASNGGKVLTSADGGVTYTVLDGTKYDLRSATADLNDTLTTNVWFAGTGGVIKYFDGTSISNQTSGVATDLNSVMARTKTDVYAVGAAGNILHLDGSGTWSTQQSGPGNDLYGVYAKSGDAIAVGEDLTIWMKTGASWNLATIPNSAPAHAQLNGIWMSPGSSLDAFAVGNAGTILHRTSLTTWEDESFSTALDLYAVFGSSNSNVVAVGESGLILRYNGTSWSEETNLTDTTYDLFGVLVSASAGLAVGADGTLATSTGAVLGFTASGWAQIL